MPENFVPHRSGAHRIAVKALYRTLLNQSKAIPLAQERQHELQNIIRNRFKQARLLQSARRLRVSFEAGYQAIDKLDNAVAGDEESVAYVTSLLERAPARVKEAQLPKQSAQKSASAKDTKPQPQKPKRSIFDRPLPLEQLSGPRHVPVLFSANRIPVLRITKPQPPRLSAYIDARIKQRQKWRDTRDRLIELRELSGYEDEWDNLTQSNDENGGLTLDNWMSEPSWTSAAYHAVGAIDSKLIAEREKNRVMAEKMQAVVDRERELFEKEKKEREEAVRAKAAEDIESDTSNVEAAQDDGHAQQNSSQP
jgi:hypothetical protein